MKTYKILFQVFGEKKAMMVVADSPEQAIKILKDKVIKIDSVIDKTEPRLNNIDYTKLNNAGLIDFFNGIFQARK